jgi:hypothetical protein
MSSSRPSDTSIIALTKAPEPALRQERHWAAIGEAFGFRATCSQSLQTDHGAANGAGQIHRIANHCAIAPRHRRTSGAAQRGQAQNLRPRVAHRIAAQQGHAIFRQRLRQTFEKARLVAVQLIGKQHPDRHSALGRKVGDVGGHQFPRYIGRILIGQEMDPRHHRVMGQDQHLAAKGQDGAIIP